jgi:hypothetical protein
MQRYLMHMDLHLGERFRFFGELTSSLEDGRNGGPRSGIDIEKLYVHQGFVDLKSTCCDRVGEAIATLISVIVGIAG